MHMRLKHAETQSNPKMSKTIVSFVYGLFEESISMVYVLSLFVLAWIVLRPILCAIVW